MPIDRELIAYYTEHPDRVPAPAFLQLAMPLSKEDLDSGALGHFTMELSTYPGFRDMATERLQACVATGFGYYSWAALQALDANIANEEQLPHSSIHLLDIVAWRMFVTGFSTLIDAMIALQGSWAANTLQVKRNYGSFGNKDGVPQTPVEACLRDVAGITNNWRGWREVKLTASGLVRVRWAAELAHEVASRCWTPDCGISLDQVNASIEQGAHMDTASLIDRSWCFSDPWPTGLYPTQFMHKDGSVAGYGWRWREIGAIHARVFATPADFKKSAVALWRQQPTEEFALQTLPATLIEVEFQNPWDPRNLESQTPKYIKVIAAHDERLGRGPWMDLVTTSGDRIALGHDLFLGNEPWTRADNSLRPGDLEGVLGLRLPSLEDAIEDAGDDTHWLWEKVPYALDELTYHTMLRLAVAESKLSQLDSDWSRPYESMSVLSKLLQLSTIMATPVPARDAESTMAEPFVREFDGFDAGDALAEVYPELVGLSQETRGEYAIAFYGKNGVRHNRRHLRRDENFMRYAVVRNLGADPSTFFRTSIGALFHLVRLDTEGAGEAKWTDPSKRARLSEQTRYLSRIIRKKYSLFDDLDDSATASRLELLQLL